MSDFVLNDDDVNDETRDFDDSDEEEENRRESGRGCGTSEEEEEKKEKEKKQKKDANGRKENESTAGFEVYSKPMPKRLRRSVTLRAPAGSDGGGVRFYRDWGDEERAKGE